MDDRARNALVLVTGATGYVGGRLLAALEQRDAQVRCMARKPGHLAARVGQRTEVVAGDCLDPQSLGPAVRGVKTAFYLVHSLGAKDFEQRDRDAAPISATRPGRNPTCWGWARSPAVT